MWVRFGITGITRKPRLLIRQRIWNIVDEITRIQKITTSEFVRRVDRQRRASAEWIRGEKNISLARAIRTYILIYLDEKLKLKRIVAEPNLLVDMMWERGYYRSFSKYLCRRYLLGSVYWSRMAWRFTLTCK